MTKQEIIEAIKQGKTVCWKNCDYIVTLIDGELYENYFPSSEFSKLYDADLELCFIDE